MTLRSLIFTALALITSGPLAFATETDSTLAGVESQGDSATFRTTELPVEMLLSSQPMSPPSHGSYYDWGRGQNGWGYCYEWAAPGYPLNGGSPVSNWFCEDLNPSYHYWGQGMNGWGYCYQYTPYGVAMNEGSPQSEWSCERVAPSYYAWGRGQNGYTYCYQWTPNGYAMNGGQPVPNFYCH